MRKIYDYKTKQVTVYPVNESAGDKPFCLYVDEFAAGDAERTLIDDIFYTTEDEAASDIFNAMAKYLKEFTDIDPNEVEYLEQEDGTVKFMCDECPVEWVVGVTTMDEASQNEDVDYGLTSEDFDKAEAKWKAYRIQYDSDELLDMIWNVFATTEAKCEIIDALDGEYGVDDDDAESSDKMDDLGEGEGANEPSAENNVNEEDTAKETEDTATNESVATRFSKYRTIFESDDDDDSDSSDDTDDNTDDNADDNSDSGDDNDDSDENSDDDKKDDDNKDDDEEEEEMKAIVLTVKKEDADKCKEQLIAAGCAEEDIEIIDNEDDDEKSKIRVDVNSVMELKDYLKGKGIDLEKEIGGEIVSDEDDDDDNDDENKDDADGEENKDDEKGDDEEFDFNNLGDLFGAEDDTNEE
jgi:hypothetical protein